jgi:hypothetical protein
MTGERIASPSIRTNAVGISGSSQIENEQFFASLMQSRGNDFLRLDDEIAEKCGF